MRFFTNFPIFSPMLPVKNDAVTFGILIGVLALIFYTTESKHPFWLKFYKYVPALLLCYFVPALLHWPLGIISNDTSKLYPFVSKMCIRDRFPPSELPVSLTLDSHKTFEQLNDLIPPDLVAHFIMQEDELPEDEFTEYLPCFRLPEATTREYISLVYWKAALMRYDFILATYTLSLIHI